MSSSPETHRNRFAKAQTELAFFMELGRNLTATLDPVEVFRIITRGIHAYVAPSHTSLFVSGDDRRTYRMDLAIGYTPPPEPLVISILEGHAGQVLRSGDRLRIGKTMLRRKSPDLVVPDAPVDLLCLPILHNKKALAAVSMTQEKAAGAMSPEQMERLERILEQTSLAVDRALLYRKTADLAITDDLTQLFNHRYIHQALDVEFKRHHRNNGEVGLIFIDLDRFKAINDTHGHLAGSRTLTEVAHVLTDNLRSNDIIARYGGDEFVVILPDTGTRTTIKVAKRLCRALEQNSFLPQLGGLALAASFGVAAYPDHATTPQKLLQRADKAMYQAKAEGGNRVVVYHPRMDETNPEKMHGTTHG